MPLSLLSEATPTAPRQISEQQQIRLAAWSAALCAGGPLALILATAIRGQPVSLPPGERSVVAVLSAVLVAGGGWLLGRRPGLGGTLASAGLLGLLFQGAEALLDSPAMALAAGLAAGWLLLMIWGVAREARGVAAAGGAPPLAMTAARARAASFVALISWFLVVVAEHAAGALALGLVALSFVVAAVFTVQWLLQAGFRDPSKVRIVLAVAAAAAIWMAVGWGDWSQVVSGAAMMAAATVVLARSVRPKPYLEPARWWETVLHHPARLLVATFLILCVSGALLLGLPAASAKHRAVGMLDASFTAVSAVCVTGLIVLDTPGDFSLLGQGAILLLIQLGGLGIMTFSTAAMGLLGRRLSLGYEGAVASTLSAGSRGELFGALRRLLVLTFAAELAGCALLSALFAMEGDGPGVALWRGLFTAVSAFCNAGFALQSNSLIPYQQNPWILHVVATLIIVGGLSPAVVAALPAVVRGRRISLQIRLVLVASLALLAGGALAIAAMEWNNSLGGLPVADRLHNAWFQSVTLRTAGFNSIDISAVRTPVLTLMMAWMFIGGSPGGTAGGIKTTTAAVLLLAVIGAIRGYGEAQAFGRRLLHETVYKAAAIATLGMLAAMIALLAVQLTQDMPGGMSLFEVISALGTVGLSTGGTARLDAVGKAVIMVTMFAGRVGPLTLFLFLSERVAKAPWEFPEERVDVG